MSGDLIFIALNASQVYKEAGPRVQNEILCIFCSFYILGGWSTTVVDLEPRAQGSVGPRFGHIQAFMYWDDKSTFPASFDYSSSLNWEKV